MTGYKASPTVLAQLLVHTLDPGRSRGAVHIVQPGLACMPMQAKTEQTRTKKPVSAARAGPEQKTLPRTVRPPCFGLYMSCVDHLHGTLLCACARAGLLSRLSMPWCRGQSSACMGVCIQGAWSICHHRLQQSSAPEHTQHVQIHPVPGGDAATGGNHHQGVKHLQGRGQIPPPACSGAHRLNTGTLRGEHRLVRRLAEEQRALRWQVGAGQAHSRYAEGIWVQLLQMLDERAHLGL